MLAILFASIFVAANASAKDGFYLGADALYSYATHKYTTLTPRLSRRLQGKEVGSENLGFGLSAGYRISADKLFFAPEIFYDHLNNKSPDFFYEESSSKQDTLRIDNRFGGKLNVGYNIHKNLDVFVNAGIASVDYAVEWPSSRRSRGVHKLAPIYGAGLIYHFNDNLALRASYDYQIFNIQYIHEGRRSEVTLDVYKVGLIYGF